MIHLNRGEGAGFVGIILFGVILSPLFKFVPFWLAKQTSSTGGGIFHKMGIPDQALHDMWIFFLKIGAETWMEAMAAGVIASLVIAALFAIWTRIRSFRERFQS